MIYHKKMNAPNTHTQTDSLITLLLTKSSLNCKSCNYKTKQQKTTILTMIKENQSIKQNYELACIQLYLTHFSFQILLP